MRGLQGELSSAAFAVEQRHLDRLRALGVPVGVLAEWALHNPYGCAHPFGVARVEDIGGGYFQPGGNVDHVLLPVIEDAALVDLVAFRSDDPGNWLLRTGYGWSLGLERGVGWWMWHEPGSVPPAGEVKHPVGKPPLLASDPLHWMRAGGDALCVIDWSASEIRSLDVLSEIVCSNPTTAALLKRALRRPQRLPRLTLMEMARAA